MRALSLLAPVLALVSVEAEPPTDDEIFNQYSCDANQLHDVIEIKANVRTPFFGAAIALKGDGWNYGEDSYVESEVQITLHNEYTRYEIDFDEVFDTYNRLNSGSYPAPYGADFFSDRVLDNNDRVLAIIAAPVDDDDIFDCNDGTDCIPPSRGIETLIRVPVCWTYNLLYYNACLDAARSDACGVCVDVENSLFLTGTTRAPTPTGDPSSSDPTQSATPDELDLNDFTRARIRSTGCRSIEVYLESDEGEDGGGDVESDEGEDGGGDVESDEGEDGGGDVESDEGDTEDGGGDVESDEGEDGGGVDGTPTAAPTAASTAAPTAFDTTSPQPSP